MLWSQVTVSVVFSILFFIFYKEILLLWWKSYCHVDACYLNWVGSCEFVVWIVVSCVSTSWSTRRSVFSICSDVVGCVLIAYSIEFLDPASEWLFWILAFFVFLVRIIKPIDLQEPSCCECFPIRLFCTIIIRIYLLFYKYNILIIEYTYYYLLFFIRILA